MGLLERDMERRQSDWDILSLLCSPQALRVLVLSP